MLERFRSAQPRAQGAIIAAGVLMFALVFSVIWYFGVHTTYAPLFTGTRTGDAATIVAELDRQKIPYRLADGGTTILVPEDKIDATRLSVMSQELPLKGTVGFELFNKSELGLTDFAQKINYQRALQGELARTIMTLDGVESARIHLSLGEDRLFREDRTPPRASVTVRMRNGNRLSDDATLGVQRLVAAAVPKLDVADVVVLDEHGDVISLVPAVETQPASNVLVQQRQAIAQYYEAQIRALLDQRFPGRPVAVAVSMAGVADGVTDLPPWNPAARAFPLRVVADPSWPLAGDAEEQMRDLISGAIGFDAGLGDEIRFGPVPRTAPAQVQLPQLNRQPVTPIPAVDPMSHVDNVSEAADFGLRDGLIALAIMVGAFVLFRVTSKRSIPTQNHPHAFADQLKTALAEEDGHGESKA